MKRPFFKFYVNDYLGDTGHLTLEEHGVYILTLSCIWKEGGRVEAEKVRKILKTHRNKWGVFLKMLSEFCDISDGYISNSRMNVELEKYEAMCRKNAENSNKRFNKSESDTQESYPVDVPKPTGSVDSGSSSLLNQKPETRSQKNIKEKVNQKESGFSEMPEAILMDLYDQFPHLDVPKYNHLLLQHMKGNKASTRTRKAITMRLRKLQAVPLDYAIEALETAIANGHQGVFPKTPPSTLKPGEQNGQRRLGQSQGEFRNSAEKQDSAIAELERGAREKLLFAGYTGTGGHPGKSLHGNVPQLQPAVPAGTHQKESTTGNTHPEIDPDQAPNEPGEMGSIEYKKLPQRLRPR